MSLTDTIKELKDQLAEEDKKEVEVVEEDEKEEEVKETSEQAKEEAPKEEPKEQIKEESPDQSAFQRIRREAAAAKKLADEREAKIAELEAKLAAPKEEEIQEDPKVTTEIDEIVRDHRMVRAEREFQSLEAKFRASNPEYDDIAREYGLAMAQAIKVQNPRLTPNEIADKTKEAILLKAAAFLGKGFDPIEEMYHEAKELGFTGKKKEEVNQEDTKEDIKPDMKKVAENRKKSTGMTSSNGKSEGQITKQSAAEFTPAEWKRLPSAEKRRLLAS